MRNYIKLYLILVLIIFVCECNAESTNEFIYYDSYDDFSQWNKDASQVEGNTEFTSYDFPGYIGAQGFGNWGSFIYEFHFPGPIKTLILEDEHNTHPSYLEVFGLVEEYKDKDTDTKVRLQVSPDGKKWVEKYYELSQGHKQAKIDLSKEYSGRQKLFVKYYFYMGNVKSQINDPRGSSISSFKLTGSLEQISGTLDKEYKVQFLGPRDRSNLIRKELPVKIAKKNSNGIVWWSNSLYHFSPWEIVYVNNFRSHIQR